VQFHCVTQKMASPRGREIPADIGANLTAEALALPDTDWHIRDLYGFAAGLGATITSARYSRYVVDLNRDASGKSLYPGADTTEVCPTSTFRQEPIYQHGQRRLDLYWLAYHQELERAIVETRDRFGAVLLFDAHSISSVLPRFFESRLPDFNLGTADGASADADLTDRMFGVLDTADGYTAILNGRFKGGYITRHYSDPANNIGEYRRSVASEERLHSAIENKTPVEFMKSTGHPSRPTV
jgi:N-formylglutamate deformylase